MKMGKIEFRKIKDILWGALFVNSIITGNLLMVGVSIIMLFKI